MGEKPEKKTTEVIPTSPSASLITWRRPSLFEQEIDTIFDDFRRSFDVMIRPYFPFETKMQMPTVRYAPIDFIDEGDHYKIHAELPGFTKENVEVQINSDGLSISAKKELEKEDKKKNFLHREREYSSIERAVHFPEEVDPSKAEGKMNNGVLELKIPKREPKPETKTRKMELK